LAKTAGEIAGRSSALAEQPSVRKSELYLM
jgi:hypothetical protein